MVMTHLPSKQKIIASDFDLDKFDQFWAVNRKLMETSAEQSHFKYIPFRCYVDDGYKQKLVKPVTNNGQKMCLSDLLKEVFPDRTESKKKTNQWTIARHLKINWALFSVRVRTHGLLPPLDTPLQWMSEHLSYPDNFLHLCVV